MASGERPMSFHQQPDLPESENLPENPSLPQEQGLFLAVYSYLAGPILHPDSRGPDHGLNNQNCPHGSFPLKIHNDRDCKTR